MRPTQLIVSTSDSRDKREPRPLKSTKVEIQLCFIFIPLQGCELIGVNRWSAHLSGLIFSPLDTHTHWDTPHQSPCVSHYMRPPMLNVLLKAKEQVKVFSQAELTFMKHLSPHGNTSSPRPLIHNPEHISFLLHLVTEFHHWPVSTGIPLLPAIALITFFNLHFSQARFAELSALFQQPAHSYTESHLGNAQCKHSPVLQHIGGI